MTDDDFALTAGWGHFGQRQAVMPGGRPRHRTPLHLRRARCAGRCHPHARREHIRHLPQRPRVLAQRPRRRLALQARRLPGPQEVALLPRAKSPRQTNAPRRSRALHQHRPPHRCNPPGNQMKLPGRVRSILALSRPVLRLIRSVLGRDGFWWVAAIAAVLLAGSLISWRFWEELGSDTESLSTTIRNVGLVLGGVIAILLAVWRSIVSERQADTAQQRLLNERYERGAEMLGSDVLSVRLGGIYALGRLAEDYPEQFHIQIMELFCAFARHPSASGRTEDLKGQTGAFVVVGESERNRLPRLREDLQAVMTRIGARDERCLRLEHERGYRLNLRGVDLTNGKLSGANLSGSDLTYAKLSEVDFWNANLSRAMIRYADLSWHPSSREEINLAIMSAADGEWESRGTIMIQVDLSDADLSGANLSNAVMPYANLTGAQLFATTLSGSDLSQASFSSNGRKPADGLTQADLGRGLC